MADPFQELLDALANQTITDEQFVILEQQIVDDPALRRRFLDFQALRGNLEELAMAEIEMSMDNGHGCRGRTGACRFIIGCPKLRPQE